MEASAAAEAIATAEASMSSTSSDDITFDGDVEKVLAVAQATALAAGEVIRDMWPRQSEILDTKSNATDLVTETDQRSEALIVARIREAYPHHAFIGEEATGAGAYELSNAPTWIVDPIDGTTNFVHRVAFTCVLISFAVNKVPYPSSTVATHALPCPTPPCPILLSPAFTCSRSRSR